MAQIELDKKKLVRDFHEVYGSYIQNHQGFPNQEIRELRKKLLEEEMQEYRDAEELNDFVEVCDALGDMLYIIYGTAVSYGIPINEIFNEIHASNMSKLDENGQPIKREDGKILKGPNFFQPNLERILTENRKEGDV